MNAVKKAEQPEQHDLFVCDLTNWPAKDDLASMDVPIFSLSKGGDTEIRKYVRGNRKTTIIPSAAGAATVFDKDLLIYAVSQIIEAKNKGLPISRRVKINSYDFLTSTERGDGGAAFDRVIDMLRRLKGTNIETNIPTNGVTKIQSFSLIEDYIVLSEKKRTVSASKGDKGNVAKEVNRILSFEIILSEWLMNGLLNYEVLTIDKGYFKLDKPYEKRIYEIGRKHCGNQPMYKENIDDFAEKMGIKGARFKVRSALKEIIKRDPLPEYHLALDESKKIDDVVLFTRNQAQLSKHVIANQLYEWYENLYRHDNFARA
jgi:plasmid replication initiation protein